VEQHEVLQEERPSELSPGMREKARRSAPQSARHVAEGSSARPNEQSKQQAAQSAGAQMQQQSSQAKAAYNKEMDTFKRGFSACMDARGYSVK
jgi:hypothetical protein